MKVYMKATGRLPAKKSQTASNQAVALTAGASIDRQARVTKLRGMARAGRYHVDSSKLAISILARALARTG
jgi:anti-sigma28 factor (negative regulator of flagellin synthesis)